MVYLHVKFVVFFVLQFSLVPGYRKIISPINYDRKRYAVVFLQSTSRISVDKKVFDPVKLLIFTILQNDGKREMLCLSSDIEVHNI